MRTHLDLLHVEAKRAGYHVGLELDEGVWSLRLLRPGTNRMENELPVRNLHGALNAAADILTEWIRYDQQKGARK